jgi:hypothetical protein
MNPIFVLLLVVATNGSERQPVATSEASNNRTRTNQSVSAGTPESAGKNLITKAIEGAATLSKAAASVPVLVKPVEDKKVSAEPTLVWVHLSRQYLSDYVERNVNRKKPVHDLILGTTVEGESHTTGKTRLVLHPNERGALGDVEFVGEVNAATIGYHGPATLQQLSHSTFRARKRLMMGESRLIGLPASAEAPTTLTTTGLHVNLPGLRGRIGNRIAWGRVARSQSQANAIASDHTADDIRRDLDKKVNESLTEMHAKLKTQIAKLRAGDRNSAMMVRSRSGADFIEVAFCRRDEGVAEMSMPRFPVEGNPDIAVRVHRSVLTRVASNPELREKFAPLFTGVLVSAPVVAGDPRNNGRQLNVANWSMAGEWLAFDLKTTSADESFPRVAMDE